jgi:hypothetical protein
MMIAGATPRFEWRPNPDGAPRTIDEACEIARSWGVIIPSYVQFSVDKYDYLDEKATAKTTTFREFEGTIIDWSGEVVATLGFLVAHQTDRTLREIEDDR